jgi:hypothetical protein
MIDAVVVLLLGTLQPHVVRGVVRDPHDLPMKSAQVTLACTTGTQQTRTAEDGRFVFTRPASTGACTLRVERAGFDIFEDRIEPAADEPLVVRLRIRVEQNVDVVAAKPEQAPFLGVTLTDADFRRIAPTTERLLDYARLLAGAASAPVIYVDGLPATTLPPLTHIASIRVNADPFSAEYADGDRPAIHIVTKAPARVFTGTLGTDGIALAGGDALDPSARSSSSALNGSFGGPVPRLPLNFRFDGGVMRRTTTTPVRAALPSAIAPERAAAAPAESDVTSAALDVSYAAPRGLVVRVVGRRTAAASSNDGAGGLTLGEAASASTSRAHEFRATTTGASQGLLHESGLLVTTNDSAIRANTQGIGILIPGAVSMGGAALTALDVARATWTAKHVVRSTSARPWTFGVTATGSGQRTDAVPNPRGQLQFDSVAAYEAASLGEPTGTLVMSGTARSIRYRNVTVAPFVQTSIVRTDHIEAVAGLRADSQQQFGLVFSPRFTIAARGRGVTLSAGAGVFARAVPETAVLLTLERAGTQPHFIVPGVSLRNPLIAPVDMPSPLRARLDPELSRPREFLQRVSVDRRFGRWAPALEYSRAQERHRLGAERVSEQGAWVDVLRSDRAATRHRLLALLRYTHGFHHLSASYQWTHARDNGGGLFATADRSGPRSEEWARTAGLAPHQISILGSVRLPAAVSIHATGTWASGAPYDITSGLDVDRNGLFLDRGGRARNSGRGPPFRDLGLYGYRRVPLRASLRKHAFHANIGVQVSNLLGSRNITSLGAVARSGTFGRPLAALPGRSVRLFLSVD